MWAGRLLLCLSLCQVIWTCSVCGRGGCCCVYHCVRSYGHVVCVGGEVVAVSIIGSGHMDM